MNIRVQVFVWSFLLLVYLCVPHSHSPSHMGNRCSVYNVYPFDVFVINVYYSCVRAFLMYYMGLCYSCYSILLSRLRTVFLGCIYVAMSSISDPLLPSAVCPSPTPGVGCYHIVHPLPQG